MARNVLPSDSLQKIAETYKKEFSAEMRELDPSLLESSEMKKVKAWWIPEHPQLACKRKRDEEDSKTSILLSFHTKQRQYAIPIITIAVKEDETEETLNDIVATFLKRGGKVKKIPDFLFLIDGKVLSTSLKRFLKANSLGTEATHEVEYLEAQLPPTPKDNLQHDDWVASVHASEHWILSGVYDNTVQIWHSDRLQKGLGKKAHKLSIEAHPAPVKCVGWLDPDSDTKTFISCSIDQTGKIWEWDCASNEVRCVSECRGHSQSIDCLAINESRTLFATGSWDTMLKIWDPASKNDFYSGHDGDDSEEPPSKIQKRKQKLALLKTPVVTLSGHSEGVSGISWTGSSQLATSSFDHTLRFWDLEVKGKVSEVIHNCAFLSLDYSSKNNLAITSGTDRYLRLYDIRTQAGLTLKARYGVQPLWSMSVKWSPHEEHHFCSGCNNGSVSIWDKRKLEMPFFTMQGHKDKVLSVDWTCKETVASGSADCTVKVLAANIKNLD